MKNLYSSDAFTGLEAAIVLIAFVVVAAVFSYVVLGAGFFTSQTAQSTVHTGVNQASSSMVQVGNVYAIGNTQDTPTHLKYANITVALTAGGTPMDLSKMVVSYTDSNGGHNADVALEDGAGATAGDCTTVQGGAATPADMAWCVAEKINPVTNDLMLNLNEQMVISISMPKTTTTANAQFTVNFQPAEGASLPITRTIPGSIMTIQPVY